MLRTRPSLPSLLLLVSLTSSLSFAAPIKIIGFDDMSCRAWTQSKTDAEQRKIYLAWVSGALSGHNYALQSQQVSAISMGTVENFVDRFCTEKPLGNFSDAALRMSDRFSGRNEAITK